MVIIDDYEQRCARKTKFDEVFEKFVDRAVDRTVDYGEKVYISQMLTTVLDLAIPLKEKSNTCPIADLDVDALHIATAEMRDLLQFDDFYDSVLQVEDCAVRARYKMKRYIKSTIEGFLFKYRITVEGIVNESYKTDFENKHLDVVNKLMALTEKLLDKNDRAKRSTDKIEITPAIRMIREIAAKRATEE